MNYLTKNNFKFSIKDGAPNEAEELISFVQRISGESDFFAYGQGEYHMPVEQLEKILESFEASDSKHYLVARTADTVLGILTFTSGLSPRTAHCGDVAIYIRKSFWSEGIGSQLMDFLIQRLVGFKKPKKINLRVRSDNARAIAMYTKKGFLEEGIVSKDTCIGGVFYDHLMMGLFIDPACAK